MKQKITQNNSSSRPFFNKIEKGVRHNHPSFDMGDMGFEEILQCTNCSSQRVQIFNRPLGRRIRCHECGHDYVIDEIGLYPTDKPFRGFLSVV